MRFLALIVFVFANITAYGQQVNDRNLFRYNEVKRQYFKESASHSAFKNTYSDSLSGYIGVKRISSNSTQFFVRPLIDFSFGLQNEEQSQLEGVGVGLELQFRHKKWHSGISYLFNKQRYAAYQSAFINKNKVVPGMSVASGAIGGRAGSTYLSAFVNYTPNKYVELEAGYGRNFIGDGYRSLLLSDAANASPYLKIQTKFWKIQYTNLFASHRNIYNVEGRGEYYEKKYTATHYLDWKATKWLNVGLFETIIWGAKEGTYSRGFDPNYANPFIFYRPVEFSVGSSDNALVGANLKLTLGKTHVLYAQLLFDEFLLSALRADANQWRNPNDSILSGWWGNKYGIQLGWTAYDLFKVKGLQARVEFNMVRPYTYAHSNSTQAYSNDNISLAHPLGANFHEFIIRINYEVKRWNFALNYHQSEQGRSSLGQNFGENVQLSNVTRAMEYENELTQGNKFVIRFSEVSVSYLLSQKLNTTVSASYIARGETNVRNNTNNNLFMLRIHSNLFNKYFDY
jgi:hypothetical protein